MPQAKWSHVVLFLATFACLSEPALIAQVGVNCSDGIFCNGEERATKSGCVPGTPPCDDGETCTVDVCVEAQGVCTHQLLPDCASCAAKKCMPKCGAHQVCGDDGCGGSCGTCAGGLFCVDGQCQVISSLGTCANPLPLFGSSGVVVPDAGIVTTANGDTSAGFDAFQAPCGNAGVPELVYAFQVNVRMGLEIRMLSADGDPNALDTVLSVHNVDCFSPAGFFPSFCSDDATPPGGLGSRVYGRLEPGSYRLMATGYSARDIGPFALQIKFVPDCVPVCDGRFCGPDGCGGACGVCSGGEVCTSSGRCAPLVCVPDCNGRQCGPDGCGGSCGTCASSDICVETTGKCIRANVCDHFQPVCGNCPPKSYCGSDCRCHRLDEPLPDLIPGPEDTVLPGIEFEWRTFDAVGCALVDGCVPSPGRFLLMRFGASIINQGSADLKAGDPTAQPQQFSYDACRRRYELTGGVAQYALRDYGGGTIRDTQSAQWCLRDTSQYELGPSVECRRTFTCTDQGIQAGWADRFENTVDCQWLVLGNTVETIPLDEWYDLEICVNPSRVYHEYTFDNNCVRIPVWIPAIPDSGQIVHYVDIVKPPLP